MDNLNVKALVAVFVLGAGCVSDADRANDQSSAVIDEGCYDACIAVFGEGVPSEQLVVYCQRACTEDENDGNRSGGRTDENGGPGHGGTGGSSSRDYENCISNGGSPVSCCKSNYTPDYCVSTSDGGTIDCESACSSPEFATCMDATHGDDETCCEAWNAPGCQENGYVPDCDVCGSTNPLNNFDKPFGGANPSPVDPSDINLNDGPCTDVNC